MTTDPTKPNEFPNVVITEKPVTDTAIQFVKTFYVAYTDLETGELYTGDFTCRRLNQIQVLQYGAEKARLVSGMPVDGGFDFLATMLAYLNVTFTIKPGWWKPEQLYDVSAIRALYDYVRAWESSFRRPAVAQRL